jgi:hypothetical protein
MTALAAHVSEILKTPTPEGYTHFVNTATGLKMIPITKSSKFYGKLSIGTHVKGSLTYDRQMAIEFQIETIDEAFF